MNKLENMRKLAGKVVILLCFFVTFEANGQAPYGSFIDYKVLPNLDTLVLNRSYGDWWFGIYTNGLFSLNFGDLLIPERPYLPISDTLNRLLLHKSKNSYNVTFGLIGEYVPKGSHWGGTVKLALLDRRWIESNAELSPEHTYSLVLDFRSIVFSPSVRYNFSIEGLHTFAGFDLEYFFSDKSKLQEVEIKKEGERLVTDWVLTASPKQFRFGMRIGAGWDLLFLNVAKIARIHWKPFISLHYGTVVFDGYNSKLNSFGIRGGVALAFSFDDITSELRKYDSTYVKPPEAIVQAPPTVRRGVNFSGFERTPLFASVELSMVPLSQVSGEVTMSEEEKVQGEVKVVETPEKPTVKPNQKIVLQGYTRADLTALTPTMKNTLDAIAEFLLVNPEYIVVIEGHSDNQGTLEQNTERGRLRAQAAASYLIARKVSPSRIRTASRSSFYPIADNSTEEGRRKNRRVEILIVK